MRRVRFVCTLTVLASVSACGAEASGATPRAHPTPDTQAAPALVQVENSAAARPQSGLSSADVVFEYLTEGGISRFSALFLHPPPGQIGPVRSARLVTIALTQRLDAVLVYSGASVYVQQRIAASGVARFDQDSAGQDLFRVAGRATPHNLYTDGSRIADLLRRADASEVSWQLWRRTETPPAGGTPARAFRVPISFAEQPVWTFDVSSNGYTRREPDTGAFTDADTQKPVVAGTVIVQQVRITQAPEVEDVSGAHGVEQDVESGGQAQVFTGGIEYDGTWSQPSQGPPRFALRNGLAAPIAPGLVWIELVAAGSPATIG
jgi:hypothetical protein